MKLDEQPQFLALIFATAELYDKTPTKAAALLYWDALKILSLEQVKDGIGKHVRDPERGKFMPRPSDVMAQAKPKRDPVVAWAQVVDSMERIGAYGTVQFVDGVTNAVIADLGGWPKLCHDNVQSDEPWLQKEFERRYKAYQDYGRESHRPLLGLCAADNLQKNLREWAGDTVLIGEHSSTVIPLLPGIESRGGRGFELIGETGNKPEGEE